MQIRVITDCPDNGINYGKYQLFRESPRKSEKVSTGSPIANVRGNSRTKTFRKSPQHSRTFCCQRKSSNALEVESLRKSANNTVTDFCGLKKIWFNANPRNNWLTAPRIFGNKLWKISVIPWKSAKVCGRVIRGRSRKLYSRTYSDSKKSARVSRTFEESVSSRMSAKVRVRNFRDRTVTDFRGLSR